MNAWLDIGIVALILLFGYSGFKRGLVYMGLNIAGTVVSLIAASTLGSMLSMMVYNLLVKDNVINGLTEATANISAATPLQAAADVMQALSNYPLNVFSLLGIDQNALADMIKNSVVSIPVMIEETIRPFAVRTISCILTVFLYLILMIIIGFLSKKFSKGVDRTALKTPNKVLGALVGVAEALLIAMLLVLIIYFVMMFISPENCTSLRESISHSIFYRLIDTINLPQMIISWISSLL